MISKELIITIFLSISISLSCFSQNNKLNEIETLSTEILSFIGKLDSNIGNYFTKEKSRKLYRHLGYFQNDLKRYLTIRRRLMDNLVSNNYNVDNPETKLEVKNLKEKLAKLSNRLFKISSLVSSELSKEAESIVERIHEAQETQQFLYLTELEKLFDGHHVDKKKLTTDGQNIYTELKSSVILISEIRSKLRSLD